MAGEESAATIYRWLEQMQNTSPQILEIFEEFYRQAPPGAAVDAISKALGLERPNPDEKVDASGLVDWFKEASGATGAQGNGQVNLGSAWTDPPAPTAGQPFKLVWEEQNVGRAPTGKYKVAIEINGRIYREVEFESLDADVKVQRQVDIEDQREGRRTFVVYSPWDGSPTSTLETQAGRMVVLSHEVPIGPDAAAEAEKERQEAEVNGAMSNAIGYLSLLTPTEFDTGNIQYALQAVANVAPSLDSTLDLMGKAAQMMARDPMTVGPEAREEAQTKAKDAIVALTAAQTRAYVDSASPVDHPDVVNAATLTAAVADVIIAAPVV